MYLRAPYGSERSRMRSSALLEGVQTGEKVQMCVLFENLREKKPFTVGRCGQSPSPPAAVRLKRDFQPVRRDIWIVLSARGRDEPFGSWL